MAASEEPRTGPVLSSGRDPVTVNERRHKFDVGDVFAMEALRPLAPGFVPWTSFSLRPSALLTVVNEIDHRRPRLVVECGGGASTLYEARVMQERCEPGSRLVVVEHDGPWSDYLRDLLTREGLDSVAQVVHAPLVDWEPPPDLADPAGSEIPLPDRWYETGPVRDAIGSDRIGLLVVDGPPGGKQLSRYPAVPSLRDLLTDDAAVMLDDAHRPAEAEAARRWAVELDRPFVIYDRMKLAVGRLGRGPTLLGT